MLNDNLSPNLKKIVENYADLNLREIYQLKQIIDEDLYEIEKNQALLDIQNAILITESDDSIQAHEFVKNIVNQTINKYGVSVVSEFYGKTRDEIELFRVLDKIYQLPQNGAKGDDPVKRKKLLTQYHHLLEKYEEEYKGSFQSGRYLQFANGRYNVL